MARRPRTDDLFTSHPGRPYDYPPARIEEKDLQGAITKDSFIPGLAPVEIVSSLPTLPNAAYPQGIVVFLTSDNKLYRSTGTAWTVAVPTVDLTGQILTAQIADAALTTAKFAAGIRPVEILGALPAAGTQGRTVFLTTDNKLYRDTGAAWTVAVPAVDVTGTITTTQIADDAITTPKLLANAVTAAKIAAHTITANEIAADTITAGEIAAGAISTSELAAGAVTAAKIAAGTITANEIAALTITAAKIAAHTITAAEIAANTITANEIVAGTITAAEIAASTITAGKLNIGTLSSIAVDVGTVTAGKIQNAGATAGVLLSGSLPGGWVRYLNLNSALTSFLVHDKLNLKYDGTAVFSGLLNIFDVAVYGGSAVTHEALHTGCTHGMTSLVDTDICGVIGAATSAFGGLFLGGYGVSGIRFEGNVTGTSECFEFKGYTKSGTTQAAIANTDPLLIVRNATTEKLKLTGQGDLKIQKGLYSNEATMLHTTTNYTNGAAAAAGTLGNAPAAGNPTKWIPVDDNGTTRYIPAW